MKYKVGDKVRIKSRNCIENFREVTQDMLEHCEMIMTINDIHKASASYIFKEDCHKRLWSDEMIEEIVDDECSQDFIEKYCKSCGTQRCDRTKEYLDGCPYYNAYMCIKQNNTMKEESSIDLTVKGEEAKERIEITIPEGYEYAIESGKIIFTKKKKEYPKTYEECYKIMGVKLSDCYIQGYKSPLLEDLQELLICRDAYWKIAGDEMGLGKPWEPVKPKNNEFVYTITRITNDIVCIEDFENCEIFEFPTEEMRDAFYENFKKEIEMCKELL